jgi:hypothetical protein
LENAAFYSPVGHRRVTGRFWFGVSGHLNAAKDRKENKRKQIANGPAFAKPTARQDTTEREQKT